MSELIKQLWSLVGALVLLAVVAPIVVKVVVEIVPVLAAGAGIAVVARLVWFYTNRS